ncbi:LPXTG-motif cell wall-anchored protein [Paenibacillus sp. PastF-3]|uniref:LPXTG cell wall anchor domain-containing protein n=1 Tax=Paenibacillus sp. PastF-3 TaxID=2940626 RepID=UPI002474E060|nr:LPXTG cell wall anchor domain-containing protein [Paenibacillus sp. PastF-3]MDH6368527.1 LPXTG-motif cell wall-anchored protein [Paenibacillus sp. PastF-3]
MKKFVIVILTIVALMPMRSMNADWAKIGQVKRYSDHEGTYSGNFSNTYPKGTPYYSIKNIDPKEIIAIKTHEAEFVKAINKGQYANGQLESKTIWISILGSLIIVLLIIWIMKRKKSKV